MTQTQTVKVDESMYDIKVQAAVLRAQDQPMAIERIRLRRPGPDDVQVRIDVTGVCHSDLSLARGVLAQPLPAVLGHEACGTVLTVGDRVTDLRVGQRVILLWIAACGECFHCARDEPHLCLLGAQRANDPYAIDETGTPVFPGLTVGSFAEQTVVPRRAVFPIPDDIATIDAALLGCAVTTGVGAVTKTTKVPAGSSVLVLGLGAVGLSAIHGARLSGADPIVAVDRNPEKADYAQAAGAHHFLVADETLRKSVRGLTANQGVDYAFDCVGSAATIRDAWSLARRGGTACIVGIGRKDDSVAFNALELFYFARTLVGCVAGSLDAQQDLPRFFNWLRSGQLNLSQLVSGQGQLGDIEEALEQLVHGQGARTLIHPGNKSSCTGRPHS